MATRFGLRRIGITFEMFHYDVVCVVGPFKNLGKYIQWEHDDPHAPPPDREPHGYTFVKDGYSPVIWIPRPPKTPEEHSTLSHEVLHAIVWMMQTRGVGPLSRENEEVYCYALSHAVAAILKALK